MFKLSEAHNAKDVTYLEPQVISRRIVIIITVSSKSDKKWSRLRASKRIGGIAQIKSNSK